MLMPKKVKHRKWHKAHVKGAATSKVMVSFGEYGIKSLGTGLITSRQIEAARRAMARFVKRTGKIWIRIFPDRPVTKKSEQMTMGSGKGPVDHYVAVVRPGTVLFEIDGVSETIAEEALRLAGQKLPVAIKVVKKI